MEVAAYVQFMLTTMAIGLSVLVAAVVCWALCEGTGWALARLQPTLQRRMCGRTTGRRDPENPSTNSEDLEGSGQAMPPSSPGENVPKSAGPDEFEIRRRAFFGL